jgi:CheY-like chemotaxis protein
MLGEQFTVAVELCRDPLWVEADSAMIEQVAMNLCMNARDSMPDGGRLIVKTGLVVLEADAPNRHRDAHPGEYACLRVCDSGSGISASVRERMFEPFFTTKERGKGIGLGLATVDGIVAKHGGFIEVESQIGRGSSFCVFLPRAAAPKQEHKVLGMPGGTERILVVEDEAAVRRIAVRLLQKLGYHVTEVASGIEALKVWEEAKGAFDLVFTDMVMPGGLSGLALCQRLKELKSGARTVITSGYTAEFIDSDTLAEQGIAFVSKPYDVMTLATSIRACLDDDKQ